MFRSFSSLFLSLVLCTASFAMVDEFMENQFTSIDDFEETDKDGYLIDLEEENEEPEFLDPTNYFAEEIAEKNSGWFCCLPFCRGVPGKNSLASMSESVTFGNFSLVRKVLKRNKNKEWDLLAYAQNAFDNGYKKMGQFILDFKKFNRERNKVKEQLEKKKKGKLKGSKLSEFKRNRKEQNKRLDEIEFQILKINFKKILEAYNTKQIISNDLLPWEIFEILAREIEIDKRLKDTVLYYLIEKYREHQFDDELKPYWTRSLWVCLRDNILLENIDSVLPNENGILGDRDNHDLDEEKQSLLAPFEKEDLAKENKDLKIELKNRHGKGSELAARAIKKGLDEAVIPFQDNYLLSIFDTKKIRHVLTGTLTYRLFHF